MEGPATAPFQTDSASSEARQAQQTGTTPTFGNNYKACIQINLCQIARNNPYYTCSVKYTNTWICTHPCAQAHIQTVAQSWNCTHTNTCLLEFLSEHSSRRADERRQGCWYTSPWMIWVFLYILIIGLGGKEHWRLDTSLITALQSNRGVKHASTSDDRHLTENMPLHWKGPAFSSLFLLSVAVIQSFSTTK